MKGDTAKTRGPAPFDQRRVSLCARSRDRDWWVDTGCAVRPNASLPSVISAETAKTLFQPQPLHTPGNAVVCGKARSEGSKKVNKKNRHSAWTGLMILLITSLAASGLSSACPEIFGSIPTASVHRHTASALCIVTTTSMCWLCGVRACFPPPRRCFSRGIALLMAWEITNWLFDDLHKALLSKDV
jgi:hypothetical protein